MGRKNKGARPRPDRAPRIRPRRFRRYLVATRAAIDRALYSFRVIIALVLIFAIFVLLFIYVPLRYRGLM